DYFRQVAPIDSPIDDAADTVFPLAGASSNGRHTPVKLPRADQQRRHSSGSTTGSNGPSSRRRRRVEAGECVTVIHTQVAMVRSILDDFLDMSRIEAGHLHFEQVGFELALLAKQCVQSFAARCKEKNIRIRLKLNQVGLPRKAYADPTRIKQLILNLLSN